MHTALTWRLTTADRPPPWSIDTKVEIFCERVDGWQLKIAELCAKGGSDHDGTNDHPAIRHSGFAVLAIALSYFEMIGKYRAGYCRHGKSAEYFNEGFRYVFPDLANVKPAWAAGLLDALYKKVRCGLYHVGGIGSGVLLTGDFQGFIGFDVPHQLLVINPHQAPSVMLDNLARYRDEILDPANVEIRENFLRRFDHDNA